MKLKGYIENGEIKIQEIDKKSAQELIDKFHYSKTMPRINKLFIGGYIGEKLIGVMTCGWGTQPKATIKKMFPSLDTRDYWELGKFCMDEEMPHNSESNFLAKCLKHIKKYHKEIKLLYTWSDGMLGKPGYIYQSANFLYGGFIWTDSFFTEQGERIHPRSCRELLIENAKMVGKEKLFWMTAEFEKFKKIQRYKGNQLRYCYFLCSKGEKKRLLKESQFDWCNTYPLKKDLKWKKRKEDLSGWELCEAPLYTKTLNAREVSRERRLVSNEEGVGQFHHLAPNSPNINKGCGKIKNNRINSLYSEKYECGAYCVPCKKIHYCDKCSKSVQNKKADAYCTCGKKLNQDSYICKCGEEYEKSENVQIANKEEAHEQ